jgi:hypothetical protein
MPTLFTSKQKSPPKGGGGSPQKSKKSSDGKREVTPLEESSSINALPNVETLISPGDSQLGIGDWSEEELKNLLTSLSPSNLLIQDLKPVAQQLFPSRDLLKVLENTDRYRCHFRSSTRTVKNLPIKATMSVYAFILVKWQLMRLPLQCIILSRMGQLSWN